MQQSRSKGNYVSEQRRSARFRHAIHYSFYFLHTWTERVRVNTFSMHIRGCVYVRGPRHESLNLLSVVKFFLQRCSISHVRARGGQRTVAALALNCLAEMLATLCATCVSLSPRTTELHQGARCAAAACRGREGLP